MTETADQLHAHIEHLEHRLRETEGLLALAEHLGGSLNRVELARRAAREVNLLLDADTTLVLRFDIERRTAVALAGHHVPEGLRSAGDAEYTVATSDVSAAVVEAFATGRPIACADLTTDHRFDYPFLSFLPRRPRGLVVIPLLARGRPYGGLISYWWDRTHVLTESGLRVAAGVASQVSLALQNAELYGEATKALADLQTAQDQLVRGQTLRALGELAEGTAHHLNNLLAVVVARVDLLLDQVKDEQVQRSLTIVERASLDAADVIRRVQEFVRARPRRRPEPVDLRAVVTDAMEMTRAVWDDVARAAGASIEVVPDLADAPPVIGDVVALREVTTNLLLNAVDAMPSGGTIVVTTRLAGPWVEMRVRDTGVGMSPETRQRAMEPFFTTKDVRRTGLGLSVAYGIVTSHRGVISLDSEEGKGTTVTVQLPPVAAAVTEPPRATRPASVTSLRILIVDDEQDVREALTLLLRQQGHVVACAASGRAALDHLATGLSVDLVLTDLGMPDMTGVGGRGDGEGAMARRARRPDHGVGQRAGRHAERAERGRFHPREAGRPELAGGRARARRAAPPRRGVGRRPPSRPPGLRGWEWRGFRVHGTSFRVPPRRTSRNHALGHGTVLALTDSRGRAPWPSR